MPTELIRLAQSLAELNIPIVSMFQPIAQLDNKCLAELCTEDPEKAQKFIDENFRRE